MLSKGVAYDDEPVFCAGVAVPEGGKGDNGIFCKPNSKTNNITDGVMNFLGAIANINKALEKAQKRLPDIKTLLRSFF